MSARSSIQSQPNEQGVPLTNIANKSHSTLQISSATGSGVSPTPIEFLNLDDESQINTLPDTMERILKIYETVSSGVIKNNQLWQELCFISLIPVDNHNPFLTFKDDRTLLQTACSYHNKTVAEEMVSMILQCPYYVKMNLETSAEVINFQSHNDGFTALHIAAKQYNKNVALLLIENYADVTLKCKKDFKPIQLILNRIPEVITAIYDAHIKKENSKDVVASDDFKLRLDYTPVCGVHGPKDEPTVFLKETGLLFESLRESTEKQRFKILEHPLANLFLSDKWDRMSWLIMGFAILHIIWCFLYVSFTYQLYFSTCPNQGENRECKPLSTGTYALGWLLLIGSLIFGGKAICNLILLPRDRQHYDFHFRHRPENSCVWVLVILSSIGVWRWISLWAQHSVQCDSYEYTLAAAGMIISFLLVLWQIKKISSLSSSFFSFLSLFPVHIELFMKVLKSILVFVVAHVALIIAFSLAFQILMPGREEYNLLDGGFFKVFTMMTTGELNYDDLFHGNETETTVPSPFSTKALLVTFQTLMNLAFLGITTGIAINDCQKLLDQSDMVNLSCRLEEMFLLEKLL